MLGSEPQTYTIAEILKWQSDGEVDLNPKFQRGSVWSPPAKSYLIDSILNGYPIPKLLFRTTVDRDTRRTLRDVVDGQQRLRTIFQFADNKLTLSRKSPNFDGKSYKTLEPEDKDTFLNYKLTCEQLLGASDEDVLEVFLRINSYTVPVNEAELRNATYNSPLSDLVKSLVESASYVWGVGVMSGRQRVRMLDQSLMSELVSYLIDGVTDGGEARITKFYKKTADCSEGDLPDVSKVESRLRETAALLEGLEATPIAQRPHFSMLFAAVLYAHDDLPAGRLTFEEVPARQLLLRDTEAIRYGLGQLNESLNADDVESAPVGAFAEAKTSTQRMRSRQVRFNLFCKALAGGLS
ncbi:DUF262 domain-containing protein [Cryobacterium sp. Hh11]|uniref:DUF262 domain-containing protein n=1 Tax=Cryobacterium sp. Hh11 TaxID=2555868 RepID=UPI00141A99CC|nr:DUF262 domain-containing protein [Cryobacterium sp. Hh11]